MNYDINYGHVVPQLSQQNIPLKDNRNGYTISFLNAEDNFKSVKPLTIDEPKKETPNYKEYRYGNIGRYYEASTNLFKTGLTENKKGYRQDIEYNPPTYLNHELYGSNGAIYNAMKNK